MYVLLQCSEVLGNIQAHGVLRELSKASLAMSELRFILMFNSHMQVCGHSDFGIMGNSLPWTDHLFLATI